MKLDIDNQSSRLILWRHYPDDALDNWRSLILPYHSALTLQIFIDTSPVEVFVNGGKRPFPVVYIRRTMTGN